MLLGRLRLSHALRRAAVRRQCSNSYKRAKHPEAEAEADAAAAEASAPSAAERAQMESTKADLLARASAGDKAAAADNLLEYYNADICARGEFWSTRMDLIKFMKSS